MTEEENPAEKMEKLLDTLDELRASVNQVCNYFERLFSGKGDELAQIRKVLFHGQGQSFDKSVSHKLAKLCEDAENCVDRFEKLLYNSKNEFQHAEDTALKWEINPPKFITGSGFYETPKRSSNHVQEMQSNTQLAKSCFQQKYNIYFKSRKFIEDYEISSDKKRDDASELPEILDAWLSRAKKDRTYHVELEKIGTDAKGRLQGFMVSLNNVIKAGVSLTYEANYDSTILLVSRVAIFGYYEKKKIHESSDILLFQRITQLAINILQQLDQKNIINELLDWISNYHDLFSVRCHKCRKFLAFQNPDDKFLLPIWRITSEQDGRMLPYHGGCLTGVVLFEE
ncbi:434_t:CDS:10 [Ambispora leptoticha]|uniref:434_t:CDS:1 n=1 Tax=Ambispora leptoticha TaxID=144679 RepID=A0A9N8VUQ6_9GLOM|nr:434_t:CDS:10 [Ambispora leptoticha]